MFPKSLASVFFVFLLLIGCSSEENIPRQNPEQEIGEFLDDWTFRIFPTAPYNNFDVGEFRLWVPKNNTDLKAVLVLLTSANGNALGLSNSAEWQAFAIQENLALCGVNLKGGGYPNASHGSGLALINAIEKIALKNNITQISSLSFLLRGYSAGGNFSYNFSIFKPEKVVGLISIRGGQLETTSKNAAVPGLILTGELEGDQRNEILKGIVLDKRNEGGLWSFAVEPNATHFTNLKASDSLARVFFSSILKKRNSENSQELNPILEDSGWLGNNTRTNIYPYADYPGNKTGAFWLTDEDFANTWLEFQN